MKHFRYMVSFNPSRMVSDPIPPPLLFEKRIRREREALRERGQSVIALRSQPVGGRAASPFSIPLCCPIQMRKMFHRSPVAS